MSDPWGQKPEFVLVVITFPGGQVVSYKFKEPEVRVDVERKFTREDLVSYGDLTEVPATYRIQVRGRDQERVDWGDWSSGQIPIQEEPEA